jgi:hypothetical protein
MEYLYIPLLILVIAGVTYVSKITLEKLETRIEPFYEFNISFPKAGSWAVVFFIIVISILALAVLLSSSQILHLRPA